VGYNLEKPQEDFNILKEFVQEMKFDRMGCFFISQENTHYLLEDDVPDNGKNKIKANEIMELQSQISWDLNQEKIDKPTVVLLIEKKVHIL
jgi:ribosomal protein S12 methylthiotransferase